MHVDSKVQKGNSPTPPAAAPLAPPPTGETQGPTNPLDDLLKMMETSFHNVTTNINNQLAPIKAHLDKLENSCSDAAAYLNYNEEADNDSHWHQNTPEQDR